MIEVVPSLLDGRGARLKLRPPRALTAGQFKALFAVLAGAMWLVAGLGWLTGNVFAPVFALLHSAIVALALRKLWCSGERGEDITIDPQVVEVSRTVAVGTQARQVFQAHPYWVRLRIEEAGERISLASSGKRVEVGTFLGPGERRQLAMQLQDLLAAASGRYR